MPVRYDDLPKPTPGTSRATSPTETEILIDVSDTIADVGDRLDTVETKLDGIEVGATADQTAAEILDAVKTVDGAGSGLDADLLDGLDAAAFLRATGEYAVNVVAASGAAVTLTLAPAHRVTLTANCTFTFPTPTAGHTFLLYVSGAFIPTFPASVVTDADTPLDYTSPTLYSFSTFEGGTPWVASVIALAVA